VCFAHVERVGHDRIVIPGDATHIHRRACDVTDRQCRVLIGIDVQGHGQGLKGGVDPASQSIGLTGDAEQAIYAIAIEGVQLRWNAAASGTAESGLAQKACLSEGIVAATQTANDGLFDACVIFKADAVGHNQIGCGAGDGTFIDGK